jgi:DNA repair protein SbcD/Mre11
MARFLHIADIHLGFDRYNNPKRTQDFYFSLVNVLERYALEPAVDFVIIAGDLFEHKSILPAILNQAKNALRLLNEANIPVITIEGNHDHSPYGTKTSWLRYLAEWEHLILLEPLEDGPTDQIFQPWNPDSRKGGYLDLPCGVRVIGSRWYGSSAPQAIQRLATGLQKLPPGPEHTVMLLHHGLEGQIARYVGALRYGDLLPLKEAGVDYLALGHIHKNYSVEDWIFNPGSLEANSVAESRDQIERGAYLVTLDGGSIDAQLHQDYTQRPIKRLSLVAQKTWSVEQLEAEAIELLSQATQAHQTQEAIVELKIKGQVGFSRLDLDVRRLREMLQDKSEALIFLLKYDVVGTEYQSFLPQETQMSRFDLESIVFKDLLAAHAAYGDTPETLDRLTRGLIDLKGQILDAPGEAHLYQLVEQLLGTDSISPTDRT